MKKNKHYISISIITFFILFTCLLGFYPGVVSYDGNNQWQQVQSGILTNSHPFFSSFFMLILSKIWNRITVIIVFQIILISITWGLFCKSINVDNKRNRIVIFLFMIFMMLNPLISIYSVTVWKDTLYTTYLFLCSVMLYAWFNNKYELSIIKYCVFGLSIAMVYSYRHNGIIVGLLLLFIFYIISIRMRIKNIINKTNFKKCFCVIGTFIIVVLMISIPKKAMLDYSSKKMKKETKDEVSISTIDGYMLWMMGAHIREGNITDKNDKIFLSKIIPLKEWNEVYNPYLINGTVQAKNYDRKYLSENNSKFEKIFIKYSLKYPITLFNHYLRADALLIDPLASYHGYVYVYCFSGLWSLPEYTIIRPKIKIANRFYMKMIDISYKGPFIMFYQPAFILYLSLILTIVLAIRVYGKKIWLFSLPMILNIISLLPINLAQDLRYVYINYWTFFGLLLLFILNIKVVFNSKNKLSKQNI